ncbi:hypothetical protein [Nonomuraea sp. NPDC005650]|uniref:hypothetical protein n=1 Tax=Nonomuraea sp. NPDC005650 TaxID=3157045 RepID=UPI0033BD8F6E
MGDVVPRGPLVGPRSTGETVAEPDGPARTMDAVRAAVGRPPPAIVGTGGDEAIPIVAGAGPSAPVSGGDDGLAGTPGPVRDAILPPAATRLGACVVRLARVVDDAMRVMVTTGLAESMTSPTGWTPDHRGQATDSPVEPSG